MLQSMGLEMLAQPGWGPRHKQKHRFLGLVHVLSSSTLSTVYQRLSQKRLKQTFPEVVSEIPESEYNLVRQQVSSWAWAQVRSIYSEQGETGVVPGNVGFMLHVWDT